MSDVDEIKKLKKLLDDGVITEEDFNNQKKKILGLNSNEGRTIESSNIRKKESELKNTLDDYETELISELAEKNSETEEINDNKDEKEEIEIEMDNENEKEARKIYNVEKAKEKARLDALSEKKKERNAEINKTINKGVSRGIKVFKWILAIFCWLMGIVCIMVAVEQNPIVYRINRHFIFNIGSYGLSKNNRKNRYI